jgi:hypothetical protein
MFGQLWDTNNLRRVKRLLCKCQLNITEAFAFISIKLGDNRTFLLPFFVGILPHSSPWGRSRDDGFHDDACQLPFLLLKSADHQPSPFLEHNDYIYIRNTQSLAEVTLHCQDISRAKVSGMRLVLRGKVTMSNSQSPGRGSQGKSSIINAALSGWLTI